MVHSSSTTSNSVCIFHNGNSRVVELYKQRYQDLVFLGNLATNTMHPLGHLYEVSYADLKDDIMLRAHKLGIKVIRHITTLEDDLVHRLPECAIDPADTSAWLDHVVINGLSWASEVVTEFRYSSTINDRVAIITTGRTASSHYEEYLRNHGVESFEYPKKTDLTWLEAKSAVLLWRRDHWDCMLSNWIAKSTQTWTHSLNGNVIDQLPDTVEPITEHYINAEWADICSKVLDDAMFFRYIIGRAINLVESENIVQKLTTSHNRISYDKTKMIPNVSEAQQEYQKSRIHDLLSIKYNIVSKHIPQLTY